MYPTILPSDQEEMIRFQHRVTASIAPEHWSQADNWQKVLAAYWLTKVAPIWDRFSFHSAQEADRVRSQLVGELLAFLPEVSWDDSLGRYLDQLIGWGEKVQTCWLQVIEQEMPKAGYLPPNTTELSGLAELWYEHLYPSLRHKGSKPSSVRGKRRHRAQRQMRRLLRELSTLPESAARTQVLSFLKGACAGYGSAFSWRSLSPARIANYLRIYLNSYRLDAFAKEKKRYRPDQWVKLFTIHDFQLLRADLPEQEQPSSLIEWVWRHFCWYRTPVWLFQRFMEGHREFGAWFVWLAKGHDFRSAPGTEQYPLTKRMLSFLWELEEAYLTASQTLWYLLVRGWGGSPDFALDVVRGNRLRSCQPDLLKWLIRYEQAWLPREAAMVYTYLEYQRREAEEEGHSFSIKGRTPASVRRQMDALFQDREAYYRARAKGIAFPLRWPASQWKGGTWEQVEIVELTSQRELEAEGIALNHCVGSYAPLCASGHSQIWSLRKRPHHGGMPLITIQVDPAGTIVQARGKRNRRPTAEEGSFIQAWAKSNGWKIGDRTWY
ncbi:MAG: PcfJ domain-containing protein [Bacteroidota bacterium]